MRLSDLDLTDARFRTSADTFEPIRHACASNPDLATFHDLGRSEAGRPLYGVTLGSGPRLVTLVAGAHADEPVGPETLRTFVLGVLAERDWLAGDGGFADLLDRFTFRIVPHLNPDAEARNRPWIEAWPDVQAFLRHRRREPPGSDVEFGFPVMRPENRAASRFLFDYEPIALHMSLHGMAFSEGAMLLIERHCVDRTEALRDGFRAAVPVNTYDDLLPLLRRMREGAEPAVLWPGVVRDWAQTSGTTAGDGGPSATGSARRIAKKAIAPPSIMLPASPIKTAARGRHRCHMLKARKPTTSAPAQAVSTRWRWLGGLVIAADHWSRTASASTITSWSSSSRPRACQAASCRSVMSGASSGTAGRTERSAVGLWA